MNIKSSRESRGLDVKRPAMSIGPRLDHLARLLGDRSRADMVSALMDGRQWTGRELAHVANVTPSTASSHLQRLTDGEIVRAVSHGRYKYYRISGPEIARALETLMIIAPQAAPRNADARAINATLRRLRTCYDHLAGEFAVALVDALVVRGAICFTDTAGSVTPLGVALFTDLGIELDSTLGRRPVCRPCLDWSERRYHLAGRAGAALARHAFENGWVVRHSDTRALEITERGVIAFRDSFGVDAQIFRAPGHGT
jgi:DNA-binding transcriptional ArsR family regulator